LIAFDIRKQDVTESTNDDAKAAAEAGVPEGAVFWALSQRSGRGRRGRSWASPEGNLYCSVVLRPITNTRNYGYYSFVAALAIADIVHALLPNAVLELKWPNDVLIGGKKISGVLIEAGLGWLVIGTGINIQHFPENPLYPVTSLGSEGAALPPLEDILALLLRALGRWCDVLETQGFAPIRTAWLARARKGAMTAHLPNEVLSGTFVDLDEVGNLHLILPNGTVRCINTGDVFL
jgi:BirA family biotin operon repressor/biotin-[acetyl-CoA-carboxylase] ligase